MDIMGKELHYNFMENNMIYPEQNGRAIYTIKQANHKRRYHKGGYYYLEDTEPCSSCHMSQEYCSLWNICAKINYNGTKKENQRYLGKKKTLIKTRPTYYRTEKRLWKNALIAVRLWFNIKKVLNARDVIMLIENGIYRKAT